MTVTLQLQMLTQQAQVKAGRYQINAISMHCHTIFGTHNRHCCLPAEQLVHQAFKVGRQVLDYHIGIAGIRIDSPKEKLQWLQPTR